MGTSVLVGVPLLGPFAAMLAGGHVNGSPMGVAFCALATVALVAWMRLDWVLSTEGGAE